MREDPYVPLSNKDYLRKCISPFLIQFQTQVQNHAKVTTVRTRANISIEPCTNGVTFLSVSIKFKMVAIVVWAPHQWRRELVQNASPAGGDSVLSQEVVATILDWTLGTSPPIKLKLLWIKPSALPYFTFWHQIVSRKFQSFKILNFISIFFLLIQSNFFFQTFKNKR